MPRTMQVHLLRGKCTREVIQAAPGSIKNPKPPIPYCMPFKPTYYTLHTQLQRGNTHTIGDPPLPITHVMKSLVHDNQNQYGKILLTSL